MRTVGLGDKDAHTRLVQGLQMSNEITRYLWNAMQANIAAQQHLRDQASNY